MYQIIWCYPYLLCSILLDIIACLYENDVSLTILKLEYDNINNNIRLQKNKRKLF